MNFVLWRCRWLVVSSCVKFLFGDKKFLTPSRLINVFVRSWASSPQQFISFSLLFIISIKSQMDEIRKIPPVTRFLCITTLVITVSTLLEVVPVYRIVYVKHLVFQRREYWRLLSNFFYGGKGFAFLINMLMLYRNSNSLEETQYNRRSYDYGWQLLLSSIAIFLLNIPFASMVHHHQLLICLTYISCAMAPEEMTSLWGLISMRQKFFPYALIALDLLDGGGLLSVARSFTGILVGHAWFTFEHAPERRQARLLAASGQTTGRRNQGGFEIIYTIWDRVSKAPGWFKRFIVGSGANEEQQSTQTDRRPFGAAAAPRGRTLGDNGPKPQIATTTGHDWGRGSRLGN